MELMRRELMSERNKVQTWKSFRWRRSGWMGKVAYQHYQTSKICWYCMWVNEMRAENLRITCSAVQRRALDFARKQGNGEFLASRGWLQKFFKCHNLYHCDGGPQRLPETTSRSHTLSGQFHHQDMETCNVLRTSIIVQNARICIPMVAALK